MKILLAEKLQRVRNLPLLSIRVIPEMMPGGFLSSTSHAKKQEIIRAIQKENNFKTFIETGTNEGEMVAAIRDCFERIYSIELDATLFARAKERFRNGSHIEIIQGNSGEVLEKILKTISSPCLFWLDAHYSGGTTAKSDSETPILAELEQILRHEVKTHVVLIDDAWCFGTMKDYPTLAQLRRFVASKTVHAMVKVTKGIIRIDL